VIPIDTSEIDAREVKKKRGEKKEWEWEESVRYCKAKKTKRKEE